MVTIKKRFSGIAGLVFLAIFVFGCISPEPEDQISIIDQREVKGESVVKTLQVNNCVGAQELKQDLQSLNQYTHDIQITPDPGVSVNMEAVNHEIRVYYNLPSGPSDAVCVIPAVVPAGVFLNFEIEWTEVWREGIFEQNKPDGQREGIYRVRESMLCEVVSQSTQPCPAP